MEKTLLVLAGPTAIGKTSCGIKIAHHFNTEIISADSRQIYRETTIGTAVPTPEEMAAVKHHFVQTISVTDAYNASKFEHQVLEKLSQLFEQSPFVLMVGGSGLYIDAVCFGIDELPPTDPVLRKQLQQRLEEEGLETITKELLKVDPVSYQRVDLKNHLRVLKALEISVQTGKPYSSFLTDSKKERPFSILRVALDMKREALYDRINRRVDRMMGSGLLEEVKRLQPLKEYTALKSVGYRELFQYLDGKVRLEAAVEQIKGNTRKYARKQLTWFRKDDQTQWFSPDQPDRIIRWIEEQLQP